MKPVNAPVYSSTVNHRVVSGALCPVCLGVVAPSCAAYRGVKGLCGWCRCVLVRDDEVVATGRQPYQRNSQRELAGSIVLLLLVLAHTIPGGQAVQPRFLAAAR